MQYINSLDDLQDNIYIYGAGMVAKLFYAYLQKTGINVIAFVVSKYEGNTNYIEGVPIITVQKINQEYQIVIATLSNVHREIEEIILINGLNKYVAISESFFDKMRSRIVFDKIQIASTKIKISEMRRLYSDDSERSLIICDDIYIKNDENNRVISDKDFLQNYEGKEKNVYILQIRWDDDWSSVIEKAFGTAENIVLSFRYKYLDYENYSLIDAAKKNGFQLTSSARFYRDQREYSTEDILLYFEKRKPHTLERDSLCNGCGMCEVNCPTHAIKMIENEYGYRKPVVDTQVCINCQKCLRECPAYRVQCSDGSKPPIYAYMASDEMRKKSSSGGIFGDIALSMIDVGGYVCGAAWTSDFKVVHKMIHDRKELQELQKSKYIRSNISDVFSDIRELLTSGKTVLFSGCPCQVAAIKKIFGKYSDKLYTIDLICAEAPSPLFLQRYLEENYAINEIEKIEFRGKDDGWRPDTLTIWDGGKKEIKHMEDKLQMAFHSRMMMDTGCEFCNFLSYPREGDISIGDAWGVPYHDISTDDGKGTSIALINSKKGAFLFEMIKDKAKMRKEIRLEWTAGNRTSNCVFPNIWRDRFYREIKEFGFNKAFSDCYEDKHDIGLVGCWSYKNYGSELTYFALYHVLKDLGYSVMMIEWPEDSFISPAGYAPLFEIQPYRNDEVAYPAKNRYELRKYNQKCRKFVLGSDQLLHPMLYRAFSRVALFDWIEPEKQKIGYALSFGHENVVYNLYEQRELDYYLNKFDAISVREKGAEKQMNDLFGILAQRVLDPVFLCKKQWYLDIAKKYVHGDYAGVFAYVLDLNAPIINSLLKISDDLGEDIRICSDAYKEQDYTAIRHPSVTYELSVEQWIGEMVNSKYVVTDSFHGMCFAIIFHKNFVVVRNKYRGGTRFDSVLELLDLNSRIVSDFEIAQCETILAEKINYDEVEKKLGAEKKKSETWLADVLKQEHISKYNSDELLSESRIARVEEMMMRARGDIYG